MLAQFSADSASVPDQHTAQAFVKQFGLTKHCPFGPANFKVFQNFTGGWNLNLTIQPPLVEGGSKLNYVGMADCIKLPCSERELAAVVYSCLLGVFLHEFEESFKFGDRRVLNPHDLPLDDPSLVEKPAPAFLATIKWGVTTP